LEIELSRHVDHLSHFSYLKKRQKKYETCASSPLEKIKGAETSKGRLAWCTQQKAMRSGALTKTTQVHNIFGVIKRSVYNEKSRLCDITRLEQCFTDWRELKIKTFLFCNRVSSTIKLEI
jgi:hypothetical protein